MATAKKGAAKKPAAKKGAAKKGAAKKPAAKKPAEKKVAAKTVQGRKVTAEVKRKGSTKADKGCVRLDIGGGQVVDLCVAPKKKAKKEDMSVTSAEQPKSIPYPVFDRAEKTKPATPYPVFDRAEERRPTTPYPVFGRAEETKPTPYPVFGRAPSKGVRRRRSR